MRKIKHLLPVGLLVLNGLATAQNNVQQSPNVPYIEVSGVYEQEVVPDEIFIGVTIRERYENRNKITIEEQEERFFSAIKSLGIDFNNLFLADANADLVKIRWRTREVLTQKNYTLKVADAQTVASVFEELDKLQILDARIARVNHSKMDSLNRAARILAIKNAKEKADDLLNAIGERTGKVMIVIEDGRILSGNIGTFRDARSIPLILRDETQVRSSGWSLPSEIHFKKIHIRANVYVKFSIQ
jgi:uncharacterized protein